MKKSTEPHRGHAIVLGGSFGGLMTARVLSAHYRQVTILEKDAVHHYPEARKGQAHTQHLHGFLPCALAILSRYFPGFKKDVTDHGGIVNDFGTAMNWFSHGGFKKNVHLGIQGVSLSRSLLEHLVRERVLALPNVRLLDKTTVSRLDFSEDLTQVKGVVIHKINGDMILGADLVVDCTGRGSRMPQWLMDAGYDEVPVNKVKIDVTYTTRVYKRAKDDAMGRNWIACTPDAPSERRNGAAFPIEGDRWIISVGGWHGEKAATDEEGFLAFLKTLPNQNIYDIASTCEPLSDIFQYKYPVSIKKNYEKLRRFPLGLLVLGDAVSSFNPVYGQGMSSVCLQVVELDKLISARVEGHRLAKVYFKRIQKIKNKLWSMSTSEDFRFPETTGNRPFGIDITNKYVSMVHKAAITDEKVSKAFLKVMGLIDPPAKLFSPMMLWRILTA